MDGMENGGGMDQDMGQEQGQGGYCIEIYVGADGRPQSVNVEQKGADEDMPPMPDAPPPPHEEKGVPVKSMEEAMQIVQQIVQNQGGMPEGGKPPHDPKQEHDELMEGYGKGSYAAQQQGMPINRVFKGNM